MHKIELLHFQDTWKGTGCHTPIVLIEGLIIGERLKEDGPLLLARLLASFSQSFSKLNQKFLKALLSGDL